MSYDQGPLEAQDKKIADHAVQEIEAKLHYTLRLRLEIYQYPDQMGDAGGLTLGLDSNGKLVGIPVECIIGIYPFARQNGSTAEVTITHEVFHCFEIQLTGSLSKFYNMKKPEAWLQEGSAEWVASDLNLGDQNGRDWWSVYFSTPQKSLFSRAYDAIGFYGHLYPGGGVSPWSVFPAMLQADGNLAAYKAATRSASVNFLRSEASVYFRKPALGSDWDQGGQESYLANSNVPSAASVDFSPDFLRVDNNYDHYSSANPFSNAVYDVQAVADVTRLTVLSGNVRLHDTDPSGPDWIDPGTLYLCSAVADSCSCQGKAGPALPDFSTGYLALTGGPTGTRIRLTGLTLPQYCSTLNPPPVNCSELPALGADFHATLREGFGPAHGAGMISVLNCSYLSTKLPGFNGYILVETFDSQQAAKSFFTSPGFYSPFPRVGGVSFYAKASPVDCKPILSDEHACTLGVAALHGSRVIEVVQDIMSRSSPSIAPSLKDTLTVLSAIVNKT